MTIDIHAHYVPAELIARARSQNDLGVRILDGAPTPALEFEYGFKVRPFFPKLIEDVQQRVAWLDSQKIDYQLVATWPDIYGYGLAEEKGVAWHRLLNDTLAAWCSENAQRFGFIASVPMTEAKDAAAEFKRTVRLGACGIMVPANVEGTNLGEVPLDPLWAEVEKTGVAPEAMTSIGRNVVAALIHDGWVAPRYDPDDPPPPPPTIRRNGD